MKMRAVVEFWLKSLIGNFTLGGLHSALGPGGAAALRRRQQAAELERTWQRESRAQMQAARDGFRGLRSGFAKLD